MGTDRHLYVGESPSSSASRRVEYECGKTTGCSPCGASAQPCRDRDRRVGSCFVTHASRRAEGPAASRGGRRPTCPRSVRTRPDHGMAPRIRDRGQRGKRGGQPDRHGPHQRRCGHHPRRTHLLRAVHRRDGTRRSGVSVDRGDDRDGGQTQRVDLWRRARMPVSHSMAMADITSRSTSPSKRCAKAATTCPTATRRPRRAASRSTSSNAEGCRRQGRTLRSGCSPSVRPARSARRGRRS